MDSIEKAQLRHRLILEIYKRPPLDAKAVNKLVETAVAKRKGLSVIRLGDAMARLLMNQNIKSLANVAEFLGIPYPPDENFRRELLTEVTAANVIGVSHFKASSVLLKKFMRQHKWSPRLLTDSFINDQLYYEGYLYHYLQNYRVCLVGRTAKYARKQLHQQNLSVAMALRLGNYREIAGVFHKLRKHSAEIDLVLVGAGVPGRIFCVKIARELRKPAIEIGHMMDALAEPEDWSKPGNRQRFKHRWIRQNTRCTEESLLKGGD